MRWSWWLLIIFLVKCSWDLHAWIRFLMVILSRLPHYVLEGSYSFHWACLLWPVFSWSVFDQTPSPDRCIFLSCSSLLHLKFSDPYGMCRTGRDLLEQNWMCQIGRILHTFIRKYFLFILEEFLILKDMMSKLT